MDISVFKNRKNYVQCGEGVIQLVWFPAVATGRLLKQRIGIGYKSIIVTAKEDSFEYIYDEDDLKILTEYVLKQQSKNTSFCENLIKLWKKDLTKFKVVCKKIDASDLRKASQYELINIYKEFSEAYYTEWSLPIIADAISLHSESLARHGLIAVLKKRNLEKEFVKYFPVLTSPLKDSFANIERKDMLKILYEVHKRALFKEKKTENSELARQVLLRNKYISEMLKNHAKKYHWIRNSYLMARDLDEKDFALELIELYNEKKDATEEINKIKQALEDTKHMKIKLIEWLGITSNLRQMFKIIEIFATLQDERKKYNLIGNHYLCRLLNEIAHRLNASYYDIAYSTPEELVESFKKGKLDMQILRKRRKFSIIVVTEKDLEILIDKEAEELMSLLSSKKFNDFSDIRGQCASIGRAQGYVKIISNVKDMTKMEKDNILVTSMTRPELIPAMKKASAIVTDEGGITCHAAIVSRELGIPCIIGTRIATKVLKDGDVVEVNANHGVVRKIK